MLLHIYSSPGRNRDAFVVGNPAGLMKLRNAIDRAIKTQYAMTEVACNDGQVYDVFVIGVVADALENRLALPYTAGSQADVVRPHELLNEENYRKLLEQQENDHG